MIETKSMLLSETIVDYRSMREIDRQRDYVLRRMTKRFIPRAGGLVSRPDGSGIETDPKRREPKREEIERLAQWKRARVERAVGERIEDAFCSEEISEHAIWETSEPQAQLSLIVEPLTIQLKDMCPNLAKLATPESS